MAVMSVFITNLGKYNEGELVGKWIDLPIDEEDLNKAFKEIGINEEYEEYFITDYESEYGIKIDEYENIYKLNEKLQELENEDSDKICAMLESGWYSDIDEVIDNVNNCDLIKGITAEQYEEDLIADGYPDLQKIMDSWLGSYVSIDYEEMAKDDDRIVETTKGVLYQV